MSAEDLVVARRVASPTVSPDGSRAVYALTETDPASYQRKTSLWQVSLAGPDAAATPLVRFDDGNATTPAFAADGRLYFLSNRKSEPAAAATTQVWVLDPGAGATPRPASAFAIAVAGFKLSPDGRRIAVWGDLPRTCATFGGCHENPAPDAGSGRHYGNGAGFVRHWDQWSKPGSYSRVFAFTLDREGRVGGTGVALDGDPARGGLVGDAPTKPFGDDSEIAWSANGKAVIYVARKADAQEPRSTNLDVWWAPVDGSAPRNLTADNKATDTLPAPSPDGKWLAWAAMARPGYEADRKVVRLRNLATGATRTLTQAWDRSVESLVWTPDSRVLLATAEQVLDTPAFQIDPASGEVQRLPLDPERDGHLANLIPLAGNRMVYTRDTIDGPAELYLAERGKGGRRLTDAASGLLSARAPIVTRRFSFEGAGGDLVWGQITKLADSTGKMPAILYVHGGPQGSFNDAWSWRWNPRVVASQGYAVLSIDFHGSTGYGQAFTDAINRDWGGKPLEDLQKGLAAALAEDPQIDGANACAMGASYGGYMMNWIEGKWPARFKCLVQHDGVFDARAMAYETEELWFDEWEHGGAYFEVPDEF
ncbi:MAG: prolyl oligopeptidase family serine peptidase, partial [Novosphingobium sp.]